MQELMTILTHFIQDDVPITLSVGVGCILMAHKLERRGHFALRAALPMVGVALWMMLMFAVGRWATAEFGLSWRVFAIVKYVGVFGFYGLSVNFMSKASFCQGLYAVTVSYSIQNMCERLMHIPRYSLTHFPVLLDRCCLLLMMALCLWVYYQLCFSPRRKRQVFDFTNMNSVFMLFLAAGVLLISIGLDTCMYGFSSVVPPSVRNAITLMSALFSFLTVVISMSHVRETEAEKQASMAIQMLNAERNRYVQEKQLHDIINVKCHDIRHQIAALGPAGYEKEIRKIGKLVDIYDATPRTQSVALDVALSSKVLACQTQNITLTCLADGRCLDFMEDSDIYALFGNILDNAIDAAAKISDPDKRQISLTVSNREGFLLIEAENFYAGEVRFEQGLPVSTKNDRDFHGFGTRSIQILTEKYGGDLSMRVEDGIFRLSIMLPIAMAA